MLPIIWQSISAQITAAIFFSGANAPEQLGFLPAVPGKLLESIAIDRLTLTSATTNISSCWSVDVPIL